MIEGHKFKERNRKWKMDNSTLLQAQCKNRKL